jgi:ABC-type polysaccharide/polyol phosphate export permease
LSNKRNMVELIIERDFRTFFTDRFLLVVMFVNFSIDLGVTGLSLAAMVKGFNYFLYVAPGANLVTATVAAFQSGRDIWRERILHNTQDYLLTLPFSRRKFAFSRLLSGMLRTTVTTLPGTVVVSLLYRLSFPLFLVGLLIMLIFSASVIGLSVVAAALASGLELFTTARSTVTVYLSFFSTQFYPVSILPGPIAVVAQFNPMTWAVDAFHGLQSGTVDLSQLAALSALSFLLLLLGYACYRKVMVF